MTRAENEQEFVLGNKQLLSAFFVVVALLGVFFVMGYIIGRNTGTGDGTGKKPSAGDPVNNPQTIAADPVPVPMATAPPTEPPQLEKRTTPAEKPAGNPVEKSAAKQVERPAAKQVEKADMTPVKVEAPVVAPAANVESSAGHTFLQVMAVKRAVADQMVKVLKERGFPSLLGESSKPDLLRVLVGPYSDPEALGKAKSDLKKMGFDAVVSK